MVGEQLVEVRTGTTHDAFGVPGVTIEGCTTLDVADGYLTVDGCVST